MDIGKNIKAIREAKRIKQVEVAELLEVDNSYYAKLEKRGNKLTVEQLEKIAVALGVSIKELLFGEKEDSNDDIGYYKNRNNDLESILFDKNEIITHLRFDIEHIQKTFYEYLDAFEMEIADKYDFKVIEYESEKGKETKTIKEFLQLPGEVKREIFISEKFAIRFEEKDKKHLYIELFQSEAYLRAMMMMVDCEILDNKNLSKAKNKYGRYDFTDVSSSIRNFTK